MLRIEHLKAGYEDIEVLKDVSLELEEGSISVLMGPNGAGKSTLLRSIYNLTHVTQGRIVYKGKDITDAKAHELLGQGISFVSQGRVNFSTLTVGDNLLMGTHGIVDKTMVEKKIQEVYKQFPVLLEKEGEYAFRLSGGQQQMLAIGRALMSSPQLLLMDEPSLGLAPKLVHEVFEKILEIKEAFGATILIVEHNIKSLMEFADYGFILVQGNIVASGRCETLKNSSIMQKVFVGEFD